MGIQIKSKHSQFLIDNILVIFITVAMFGLYALDFPYSGYVVTGLIVLALFFLLYQYVKLRCYTWTIGPETIKIERSVFSKNIDYVELYRVIDYREYQTFIQRLFGLKTILIKSDDPTNPNVQIFGIKASENYIGQIRELVEQCKTKKRVLEINNH